MIGTQIKRLLAAKEISQTTLAEKMHISDSKLSKMINGTLEPNTTDLVLLSQIFDVSIDELVKGESVYGSSLIEKAIQSGKDEFNKLINNERSLMTSLDDKGKDIFYYIRKHDAYDLLAPLYFINGKFASSKIQRYYVKTVTKLLQNKQYDQYQAFVKKDLIWSLSELCANEHEEQLIIDSIRGSSHLVVYEVIAKHQRKSSPLQSYFKNEEIASINLINYTILGYPRRKFDEFCDAILMNQIADPKYLKNRELAKAYLPTYLAKKAEIQLEWIDKLQKQSLNLEEREALLESLFLKGEDDVLFDLFSKHLEDSEYLHLKDVQKENQHRPQHYFRIQSKFVNEIFLVQYYFKLCVTHNKKILFTKLLNHPKLKQFIDHAKQEQLNELSGYCFSDVKPKPIIFFDFNMPDSFQNILKQAKL